MDLLSNKLTWRRIARDAAIILTVYASAILFVPKQLFMEAINSMLAVISLTVAVVYACGLRSLVQNGNIAIAMIRSGIVITWGMAFITSTYRVYTIANHMPRWGVYDVAYGFPVFIVLAGASVHLIAIGMVENRYVRRNVCLVLWSLAVGAAVAVGLRVAGFSHWS